MTSEQANETYYLTGELIDVTGDGFIADFYPNQTTVKTFEEEI
jgi:hypothetical protein